MKVVDNMKIVIFSLLILFPLVSLSQNDTDIDKHYYDKLKEYLAIVNKKIKIYHNKHQKFPVRPEAVELVKSNPYPDIFYFEEGWWTPDVDDYSITVSIKGTDKILTCGSSFKSGIISCIHITYEDNITYKD